MKTFNITNFSLTVNGVPIGPNFETPFDPEELSEFREKLRGEIQFKILNQPKFTPFLMPQHYLVTSEKGVSEGIKAFGKISKSYPIKRIYDVVLSNGLKLKCCILVVSPGQHNVFPGVGDDCVVLFQRPPRAKRAHFKPNMRRRLKAVKR